MIQVKSKEDVENELWEYFSEDSEELELNADGLSKELQYLFPFVKIKRFKKFAYFYLNKK